MLPLVSSSHDSYHPIPRTRENTGSSDFTEFDLSPRYDEHQESS